MITPNKTCSFFGHREIEITPELKQKLYSIIEDLIVNKNFVYFYFGGFGDFDSLCHEIVSELKVKFPHIKRIFCLADPRHQRISKRPKWLLSQDYEDFVYFDMPFDWWFQRIYYRNVEIIDRSDFIIFYVKNTTNSGAYKAMQYATKKNLTFINIL